MRTSRVLFLSLGVVLLSTSFIHAETDPLIEEMVTAVSSERIAGYVQTLQDFQTRHTYTQGNTDAGDWLFDFFEGLGLEVRRHEFTYGSHTEENIIARIPGTTLPDEIVAVSGHFDSTSESPYTLAPGADDDASGIAGVLEAAFIFRNYQFARTVEFMCFNAEEQGRRGSIAIANDYLSEGRNLVAVVNSDMIGYWPTAWGRNLDVAYEPVSEWLADLVVDACGDYVRIPVAKQLSGVCRDDHYSFTQVGISAVTNMDCWEAHNGGGESTPHYHRTTDTIETLNLDCLAQAVQVNVASVAELATPTAASGVDPEEASPPLATVQLLGNWPNPFNMSTEIAFSARSGGEWISLQIFNSQGRLVREIAGGAFDVGPLSFHWDGLDAQGMELPSGIYLYQLVYPGGVSEIEKAVIIK